MFMTGKFCTCLLFQILCSRDCSGTFLPAPSWSHLQVCQICKIQPTVLKNSFKSIDDLLVLFGLHGRNTDKNRIKKGLNPRTMWSDKY